MQPAQLRRLADNYHSVLQEIADRAPGRAIRLVCVTKYARDEWVEGILQFGANELGENLLPQAAQRFSLWNSRGYSFTRNLLGAQQSRKVSLIPSSCDLFQALDREKIVEPLNASAAKIGCVLDVLLEVNVDNEPQKSGFALLQIPSLVSLIQENYPCLNPRGLMCIPKAQAAHQSVCSYEREVRASFNNIRLAFDKIAAAASRPTGWDVLSMGMSQDFAWAIDEGSTMVRIGSRLFAGLEG